MHDVVINAATSDTENFYDMITVLGVVFMVIVVPLALAILGPRRRKANAADEQANAELRDRARRIETRIEQLEHLLDSELPGWRTRL